MTDIVLKDIDDPRIHFDVLTSILKTTGSFKPSYLKLNDLIHRCIKCGSDEFKCDQCKFNDSWVPLPLAASDNKCIRIILNAIATLPSPTFETFMNMLQQMRPLALKAQEEAHTLEQEVTHDPAA